jgi:cell division protein FtsI (penicillin-binding protein 3)
MNDNIQHPIPSSSNSRNVWRLRVRLLQYGLLLFFVALCLRLVQVQVVESQSYHKIAQGQYQSKVLLPATRGSLFDRNGNVIASNSMFVSFAADPQIAADDARSIAAKFSKAFGKPRSYYAEKLHSDSRFVWLERQVPMEIVKNINVHDLDGIVIRYEPKRLYHRDQVAGQLVGFTDIDNNGLAGTESVFDKELHGVDGYVVLQRDGLGRARPSVDYPRVEPIRGHDISLTIDLGVQAIAEEELRKGIEQNKAESGIVVILQPKTGEVLAIAQYPGINPNKFSAYDLKDQKLRAVTDMFEPGSVFKVVTASAALENGLVTPERKFFAEHGVYNVWISNSSKPRQIKDTHEYGWITFQEAMEFSSNIVMAKVSDLIGSERLYKMARDFGFGISTSIDVPGEVRGSLKKPSDWSGTTLNTIAFGYEVGVTPIQIATAYAAVANDGILMKPYVFQKEVDEQGQTVRASQPQVIRRVISEKTARTLKDFFEGVVDVGTGKPAKIEGIRVAGKTGTSKKYAEGHYETGSYTASFVGFFPVEDPRVVCLVMMDNPRGGNYTGGTTSAPVFRAIAERILHTHEMFAPAPHEHETIAKVDNPVKPQSNASVSSGSARPVDQESRPEAIAASRHVVPDVRGFSVRRAISILSQEKLQPVINGSGTVVAQAPPAGQAVAVGMKIVLTCQPRSLASTNAN